MSNDDVWRQLLHDALVMLSLPPEEQIRLNGPGCVVCDMAEDFLYARSVAAEFAATLTMEQRKSLDRIHATLKSLEGLDAECNPDTIRRPLWHSLRDLARDARGHFGWEHAQAKPFEEVQPSVWHRPLG